MHPTRTESDTARPDIFGPSRVYNDNHIMHVLIPKNMKVSEIWNDIKLTRDQIDSKHAEVLNDNNMLKAAISQKQ